MNCGDIQKRLSAYADGELTKDKRKTIESHLRDCETCREALMTSEKIWKLLEMLPDAEPVSYFYSRLKARMKADIIDKRFKWIERILIPVSAVVAILLGIVFGSIVGSNGSRQIQANVTDEELIASYLNSLEDFPSISLGEAYLELASQDQ